MVVAPVAQAVWRPVASLEQTQRGAGGFGSTGTQARAGRRARRTGLRRAGLRRAGLGWAGAPGAGRQEGRTTDERVRGTMLRLSKKLLFAIEAVCRHRLPLQQRPGALHRHLAPPGHPAPLPGAGAAAARPPRHPRRPARAARRLPPGARATTRSRSARSSASCAKLEGTPDPASEPDGSEIGVKVVRPIWIDMQREMMERFDNTTIEELCRRAREKGIQGRDQSLGRLFDLSRPRRRRPPPGAPSFVPPLFHGIIWGLIWYFPCQRTKSGARAARRPRRPREAGGPVP